MSLNISPIWWSGSPDELTILRNGIDPVISSFPDNPVPCDKHGHANELNLLNAVYSEEKQWKCHYTGCASPITKRVVDPALQLFLHDYLNEAKVIEEAIRLESE